MTETRKIAAILAADVVGFSRMASADEDRTLARLRALRTDLIDPIIESQNGRVFKRTGDGALVEFHSVVEAVRCAISMQNAMAERNVGTPEDQRIVFRIGIHLGDVVEESDGDLMGDGVNIAARLEGIAKPGAICLSEDAFRQVRGRLDLAVVDLGLTRLKNIAEPVRAYSLLVGAPATAKPKRRAPLLAMVAILAALAVAGGYVYVRTRPAPVIATAPAEAAHLSIVVLPFTNLSGDPAQDYFVDGVTDNLTTDLSRIRNSFVIARNTAFTFKGKAVDAKEIGKELGVRYVLEGSVQRERSRVRVNVQLIDAETGAHLWAERFEEEVADLFKLQDQVVARLANTLRYELIKAEADVAAHSKNPDVIDLIMRGYAANFVFTSTQSKSSLAAMRGYFEQALKIDANDPEALAGSARSYAVEISNGWRNPETDYEVKALGQAERSIELDRRQPLAYYAKSMYLISVRRYEEALRTADIGLSFEPNSPPLYFIRAVVEGYLLKLEQARADLLQAFRLSPRDPAVGAWHQVLALVEIGLGHIDAAIEAGNKATDEGNRSATPYFHLAAAYALKGDMDEARTALAEARRVGPTLCSVKRLQAIWFNYPPYYDALRKAGLPEEC